MQRAAEVQIEDASAGTEFVSLSAERLLSAESLASLLTLSYEPMFAWRPDGPIEFWNTGAERLYGFSPSEAVGRSSHALLQTQFPTNLAELLLHLRSRRYWTGELRHICKDGREVIVDSRMQLLGDDTVLEVNSDVTSSAIFRAVFNQSGIFAGILDSRGRLREANDLSLEWCGYTKDQVLERPFWDTPWWRGSEEMKAKIRIATEQAASGHIFREELRYWLADGTERIVDFAMHPIRDRSGKVAFLHPTGIDITDRKRVQAELRESEQRLRYLGSIVESSDDAIVSKNLDGIIMSWNRGAERVFGYTADEVIGQPITIVIPEDRQSEEGEILTRIRRGERVDQFETVRKRKDGNLIVVSLTISPVHDDEGKIIGASKVARDITEQKRSRDQIATLAREAEHRTRNILATVTATVALSRSDTPEGLKAAIHGRIQALANVHALFVESRWTGAELHQLVARELSPYRTDGARALIDGPEIVLEASAAQALAVTLHELATNAAKYGSLSNPGGKVQVTWSLSAKDALALRWTETDGPPVQAPARCGFGSRVMETMIKQIGGTVDFDWQERGLVCEIVLPVEPARR